MPADSILTSFCIASRRWFASTPARCSRSRMREVGAFSPRCVRSMGRGAVACALVALVLAACEDMAPVVSDVPNVAGTYTGAVTLGIPELSITVSGRMRIVAVQDGATVTLSGSQTWGEVTSGLPATTGTVSKTGVFVAEESGVIDADAALQDTACGRLTPVSASTVFVSNRLEMEGSMQSTLCGLVTLHANLSR